MKIVNKLIPITEKVENAERLGQKFSSFSEDNQAMITMANEILQRILQIIFSAIKNDSVQYKHFSIIYIILTITITGKSNVCC